MFKCVNDDYNVNFLLKIVIFKRLKYYNIDDIIKNFFTIYYYRYYYYYFFNQK